MKSSDYDQPGHARFGGVQLIGKRKGCGKENCSECPHGPFWYAYVHAVESVAGVRTEVYLGRTWTDADLRAKVAVKMVAGARREFLSAVETVVRSERIKWLEQEAARVRQEMNAVASRAQKEIGKLRRDEAGIRKELRELRGEG